MSTTTTKRRPLERTRYPGIFKRGNSYVVVYRDPRGRQRKAFAATLSEARDVKASLRADIARGEYRTATKQTLAEYAAEWIESYGGRTRSGLRDETRADYAKRLEADVLPVLGRMRLAEIEPKHVKRLAAEIASRPPACRSCRGRGVRGTAGRRCPKCEGTGHREGQVTPGTVRLSLAPLKALLATAHAEGDIRQNPTAGLRLAQTQPVNDLVDDEDVKALSEEELARLLLELPSEWRPFFEFLAHTGLRIGEAIELRWKDVDIERRALHVRRRYYRGKVGPPKSKYGRRRIPLTPAMAEQLDQLRSDGSPDDLVWRSEKGRRLDCSNVMSRVLKPAAVAAGIGDWPGFHTFRHTAATMLFRHGWNPVQVQRFLGHHKPSFTVDVYVHLLADDLPEPTFLDERTAAARWGGATVGQHKPPKEAEIAESESLSVSAN